MSFFILTGAILLGTVFIVHFAANALGFRLFYTSLFLSAVFALSINLIVISMKEVTSPLAIAKIFLAVLFASAFVTVINEVLVRREKKKLQEKRKRRNEEAKEKALEAALDEGELEDEDVEEKESVKKKENFVKRLWGKIFAFRLKKKKSSDEEYSPYDGEISEEIEDKENDADAAKNEIGEETKEIIEDKETEEILPEKETAKEEQESPTKEEAPEETPKKESFIKKLFKKEEPPKREKVDISQFADLDALLDFAYEAKISGKYEDAVDVYEGAIEKYEDDSYLPFLFIDLANVHKGQGEYDAAIDVYKKAVNMPNIEKDSNILKSFNENIDYLKALKTVLRKHKIEHKPFGEIDESILKEAEEKAESQVNAD